MWFGVAPQSPAHVSHKDTHLPQCSSGVLQDKGQKKKLQATNLSIRRGQQSSILETLRLKHRTVVGDRMGASPRKARNEKMGEQTPRNQLQKKLQEVKRQNRVVNEIKSRNENVTTPFSLPQQLNRDENGTNCVDKYLHQLENCQINGSNETTKIASESEKVAFHDLRLKSLPYNIQKKENKSRHSSVVKDAINFERGLLNPETISQKVPSMVDRQVDVNFGVSQVISPSRSSSAHRINALPSTGNEFDNLDHGTTTARREWSIIPAPFVSLHPKHLVGHVASVCSLVTRENRLIVSCSVDGSVKIWSSVTFECLQTLSGHRDVVSCVDFNMRWLVSGSHDQTLRVYDYKNNNSFNFLHVLAGHTNHVTQVRLPVSFPGHLISCSDDCTLRLWNAETGHSILEFVAHDSRVTCFDIQFRHLCSGAADGSLCFWDLSSFNTDPETALSSRLPCAKIYYVHKATVQCIVDTSSNRVDTLKPRGTVELPIVTGSNDGTIQLFSAQTFAHLGRLDNVGSPVYAITPVSPIRLLCATKDGRLLLYDNFQYPVGLSRAPATLKVAATWISSLQVCGDLVACSSEERLYIVDVSAMCMVLAFETQHSFITSTQWLHPGVLLTAGQDHVIKRWSIS